MIIPSIDLMGGQTVQLVGGKDKALDAGDPLPIAERFRLAGEIAVIDLDAAMGKGSNRALIEKLIAVAPCRVGGGIRDLATARDWLNRGARKVILGTRAVPEILRELPPDRVIAALDANHGEVVVEGWQTGTGRTVLERMKELEGLVGGYLVTFVEREGRLGGTAGGAEVSALVAAAKGARVTVAGGVTTAEDIAALDHLGADAQVGMALYTGRLDLGEAIAAPLAAKLGLDATWPTVLVDQYGIALGYRSSTAETIRRAINERRAFTVEDPDPEPLLAVDLDCTRTSFRFRVEAAREACASMRRFSCWGQGEGLSALARVLASRTETAPPGSYTRRLLDDPALLEAKLVEEAHELAQAKTAVEVAGETADVIFFALVAMARGGVPLSAVETELARRSLKLERRPGDAKPQAGLQDATSETKEEP